MLFIYTMHVFQEVSKSYYLDHKTEQNIHVLNRHFLANMERPRKIRVKEEPGE